MKKLMTRICVLALHLVSVILGAVVGSPKDVLVTSLIVPPHVQRGENVELRCGHNLSPENLYSIKWYRDDREFFRFMPSFENQKEAFPLPGVNVDEEQSNGNTVYLRRVDQNSSGRYKCEVISEAPDYHTADKSAPLLVIDVPQEKPTISGTRHEYRIGDSARLTCISANSRPAANLTWYINGKEAPSEYVKRLPSSYFPNNLEQTKLEIRFRVTRDHFVKGTMSLKCSARISSVYYKTQLHSVDGQLIYNIPMIESSGIELLVGTFIITVCSFLALSLWSTTQGIGQSLTAQAMQHRATSTR